MVPFSQFDRSQLNLKSLPEREHDLSYDIMMDPEREEIFDFEHPALTTLSQKIISARKNEASVIFMLGAHVIRAGVAPFLIKLMEQGLITHIALNGAGVIHDFELARIGATTESVAKYIKEGQFGLWQETGEINEAVKKGVKNNLGLGESVGKMIENQNFKYKDTSLLAAGYRLQVPVTVHVSIGCDIIHEHPNFSGKATGEASYTDFLIYTKQVQKLEKGVFLNFGSAVTGPEVFLKSLAMARNVAHQKNREIKNFTTAVFDLLPLEKENTAEVPEKSNPHYYFRPWKNILARTVAEGGQSFYVQGRHRHTIPALYKKLFQIKGGDI